MHTEAPRRGAIRSEAARTAILEATARQFAERGFDHMTMERIASAAGVGKQTIYRWWPSKGALVAECLLEGMLLPTSFRPTDTGDLRADLISWLDELLGFVQAPESQTLVRSLLAAAGENDEVGHLIHDALSGYGIGAEPNLTDRLAAGQRAGQLRANAPIDEIIEALVGAVILRVISRLPVDPQTSARLVDAVLG